MSEPGVEQLPEKWRRRAEKAQEAGYTEKAIAVLDFADELEERMDADDDPEVCTDGGESQETGTEQTRVGQVIGDVSDETLGDAATELQQCADHISCANERRGAEFQLIADHLRELQGETLLPSDEVEDRVDGALISGFLVGASASLGLVVLYLVARRAIEVML